MGPRMTILFHLPLSYWEPSCPAGAAGMPVISVMPGKVMLWCTATNQFHTCSCDAAPVAYPSRRPESCVHTTYSLPAGVCSQNTRPIAASAGTFPVASCPTVYLVEYWSEWFQVFSAVGSGASAPHTCTFSTDPKGFLVRLSMISWYFVYSAVMLG